MTVATASNLDQRVWPDVHSSTDSYATRFAGPVGQYFVNVQSEAIRRQLQIHRIASALDIGGGHGQILPVLVDSEIATTVVGSKLKCEQRLANYRDRADYTFVESNLFPLEYGDSSFDLVLSFRMISHLHDWPCLIDEMCRTARTTIMFDFAPTSLLRFLSGLTFSVKNLVEKNTRRFLTQRLSEIDEVVARNGFRVSSVYRQFALPMALHRLIKMPRITGSVESISRTCGVTNRIGGPVIITATRH
ncbi:MAG: class I SAM-dependent methyltransferase [Planctomycetales bacterium]|nr:class I SAM-dependent methyltransferase [Planctomycetales bacterium]